jgi:hypothetical protein
MLELRVINNYLKVKPSEFWCSRVRPLLLGTSSCSLNSLSQYILFLLLSKSSELAHQRVGHQETPNMPTAVMESVAVNTATDLTVGTRSIL